MGGGRGFYLLSPPSGQAPHQWDDSSSLVLPPFVVFVVGSAKEGTKKQKTNAENRTLSPFSR